MELLLLKPNNVGAGFMPALGFRATTRVAPTITHTIGDIVGAFKSLTTHEYIINNPLMWDRDRNNLFYY